MPTAAVGWFGKLPAHGDFVRRRLDPGFVGAWDAWLASGLAALRSAAPETWLDAYMASPSWRFVIGPGVLPGGAGAHAWAGVLMPSVDRVGRCFPLTAAWPLPAALEPRATAMSAVADQTLWSWLAELDERLLAAVQDEWDADRLDAALAELGPPPARLQAVEQGVLWRCDTDLHGALSERTPTLPEGAGFAALLARAQAARSPPPASRT